MCDNQHRCGSTTSRHGEQPLGEQCNANVVRRTHRKQTRSESVWIRCPNGTDRCAARMATIGRSRAACGRAPVLLEHSAAPWSRRKRESRHVVDSTGRSRVYGTISHTLYLIPNGPSTTVGPAECTWAHLYTSWVRCG